MPVPLITLQRLDCIADGVSCGRRLPIARGRNMGVLANFKIRTKVLIALLPLAIMVVAAALYSSVEMKRIDTLYSNLLGTEVSLLLRLTFARAANNRFEQFLYKEIAETDVDRVRVTDAELDQVEVEFRTVSAQAREINPDHTQAIDSISAMFARQFADASPVRAAALNHEHEKALRLMRERVEPEWNSTRKAIADLQNAVQERVGPRSAELTRAHPSRHYDHLDCHPTRPAHIVRHCAHHRAG